MYTNVFLPVLLNKHMLWLCDDIKTVDKIYLSDCKEYGKSPSNSLDYWKTPRCVATVCRTLQLGDL